MAQPKLTNGELIKQYFRGGSIPWSKGYAEYKFDLIYNSIANQEVIEQFKNFNSIPAGFAKGVDERAVEYPWLFSQISIGKTKFLDAGSTFNFKEIIEAPALKEKEITIATFFPERNKFNEKRISYVYADLRELPFRNDWFDEIICQSTLEHIDMDNSMYGYEMKNAGGEKQKSYEYMKVIHELSRILKKDGILLLTFPYGKFENHGFFQQFDHEMISHIATYFNAHGKTELKFLKYLSDGWIISNQNDCEDAFSFNPHTQIGKGNDGAAHSRAICCVRFIKA